MSASDEPTEAFVFDGWGFVPIERPSPRKDAVSASPAENRRSIAK